MRRWDLSTGKEIQNLCHSGDVFTARFSPDGNKCLSSSSDETARLLDLTSGKTMQTLSGHVGMVFSADFSPDGITCLTSSSDKTIR